MTIAEIQRYFEHQVDKIDRNYVRAVLKQEGEAVHDLRVAIKRLRTLRRLLRENQLLKPSARNFIRDLRKIYRPLGRLRDLQVRRELLDHYKFAGGDLFSPVFENLENGCRRSRLKLRSTFRHFPYTAFYRFKHSRPYRNGGPDSRIDHRAFLIRRLRSILFHLGMEDRFAHYHEIRKKLKEIDYLLEMQGLNFLQFDGLRCELTVLKQLEDLIGGWRDRVMLLHELHPLVLAQGTALDFAQEVKIEHLRNDIRDLEQSAITELMRLGKEAERAGIRPSGPAAADHPVQ
jgi:CHAD domain-containing protein